MNKKPKTYFLVITTWTGITALASHWYGRISDENGEHVKVSTHGSDLVKRMTAKEARTMCEYEKITKDVPHGKKGHWCIWTGRPNTTRFDSRQEVIDRALAWFNTKAESNSILRLGNHWNPDSSKIIARK